MKQGYSLEQLLHEVIRQNGSKEDFVTSTKDNVRLVMGPEDKILRIVLLRDGEHELRRFEITEHAHSQIASKLEVPFKYYQRLAEDHPDLLLQNVNTIFDREPKNRLLRVLDGRVRAFMSDRYLRLDNNEVLERTLPTIVNGGFQTTLLSSHVDENKMHLKVLFTGDELKHEITTARGEPRIMRPGFRLSNSETGQGSLRMDAFFFDSFCTNGCVFGMKDAFAYSRHHVGGKLIEGADFQVVSDETKQLENATIIAHVRDAMTAISNPDLVGKMATRLREIASGERVQNPVAAVDATIKLLPLREAERDSILETFLRDQDYTQFGMMSAVTEIANKDETSYQRACEIEDIGARILDLNSAQWHQIAQAEKVAA